MSGRNLVFLVAVGLCFTAACTAVDEDDVVPTSSTPTTMLESKTPSTPSGSGSSPTGQVAPSLIGMVWPEAQSRAGSIGLTVVPIVVGGTGGLRGDCRVAQQQPPPGVPLRIPVVELQIVCPPQPQASEIPNGAQLRE